MNALARAMPKTFILHPSAFILGLAVWLLSGNLSAQVVRLPAVDPTPPATPGQLVSHPDSTQQILQAPGQSDVAPASPQPGEPQLPPGVRNGVFQRAMFDATWLAPGGVDGMGETDLQVQGIFALPCPTRNSPLVITPGYSVNYLQGPVNVDLPPQLHEAYTQFRWLSQVTPQLGLDFAVTPGVYSDFNQASNKAFRLTGHGAAAWTWNEQVKLVLGVAYLDMPDTNVIPIGGLMWMPNADTKFDLVFPHPKISRRIRWFGQDGDDVQDWAYVAGEFANDAWAIRQTDGANCQVLLRDYRLVLGVERTVVGGVSSRLEVGYVFGRRIRYTNDTPDFYPADTVMIRGGLTY
jgi:hypothetical protein